MYSNNEKESDLELKECTSNVFSVEKRNKKIARVRLSVQATIFNASRGSFAMNTSIQNDGLVDVEHNKASSENLLSSQRKLSSENISLSQKDIDKNPKLPHKFIWETEENPLSSTSILNNLNNEDPSTATQELDSFGTRNNSPSLKERFVGHKYGHQGSLNISASSEEESLDSFQDIDPSSGELLGGSPEKRDSFFNYMTNGRKQRHSIFFNNQLDEMEELKKELEIEGNQSIYFIQGNFHAYFQEQEILGEGASGTVKRCVKNGTDEVYAVKIMRYRGDTELLSLQVKEFKNHKKLNHKSIIKVYELYIDYFTKKVYLVMELAECEEMFEIIKNFGHYSEAVASEIFKQILNGINYLHMNGVCHRDLKPNNILVSKDGKVVKITDFNVSKFSEKKAKDFIALSNSNYKMWTHTGTVAFTAPEVFTDSQYTEAVDMWSAGVVLYTMLCGYQPFQAESFQELIAIIQEGKFEFHSNPWDNISQQAKDLINFLLNVNPKTRYSPFEALMHPWISNNGKVSNKNINGVIENLWDYLNRSNSQKLKLDKDMPNDDSQNSPNERVERKKSKEFLKTKEEFFPMKQSMDKFENEPHLTDEKHDYENSSKKNKEFFFVNHFSLTKMTNSSSQIEGKCLKSLSETNQNGNNFAGVFQGLHHFSTYEELPQVFGPSIKEVYPPTDLKHEVQEQTSKPNVQIT